MCVCVGECVCVCVRACVCARARQVERCTYPNSYSSTWMEFCLRQQTKPSGLDTIVLNLMYMMETPYYLKYWRLSHGAVDLASVADIQIRMPDRVQPGLL